MWFCLVGMFDRLLNFKVPKVMAIPRGMTWIQIDSCLVNVERLWLFEPLPSKWAPAPPRSVTYSRTCESNQVTG